MLERAKPPGQTGATSGTLQGAKPANNAIIPQLSNNGNTIPRRDAWLLASYLAGTKQLQPETLSSDLARATAQAMANGQPRREAFTAFVTSLPRPTADALQRAVFAEDPAIEPTEASPGKSRYVLHWAKEALEPQEPIEWVIDKIAAKKSVNAWVGPPGAKKTLTALSAGVHVAMGLEWQGFEVSQGTVLVIDEESGDFRMKKRLSAIQRGIGSLEDIALCYVSLAGFNLREPADIATLTALIDVVQPTLVIIDALADIMLGGDENSVKDTQPIFHVLRSLADEKNLAIIVIHHANKAGTYRGSTAIKGAVDTMLMVDSKPDSPNIDFETDKTRDTEPFKFSAAISFDELTDTIALRPTGAQPKSERLSKSQAYVIRYLSEHGQVQMDDIMSHADTCSANAARLAVWSLVDKKKVKRTDGGGPGEKATFDLAERQGGPHGF